MPVAKVTTGAIVGLDPVPITVEVNVEKRGFPAFNIVGAAIASIITRIGNTALLLIEGKRKFGLVVDFKAMVKPLIGSILMAGVLLLIKNFVVIDGIIPLLVFVGFGGGLYVIVEYFLGFDIFIFIRKVLGILLEK